MPDSTTIYTPTTVTTTTTSTNVCATTCTNGAFYLQAQNSGTDQDNGFAAYSACCPGAIYEFGQMDEAYTFSLVSNGALDNCGDIAYYTGNSDSVVQLAFYPNGYADPLSCTIGTGILSRDVSDDFANTFYLDQDGYDYLSFGSAGSLDYPSVALIPYCA